MKMDVTYFLHFIICYHFLCNKVQAQYEKPICGLPALPFRGNVTPYKNEYEFDSTVEYKCDVGYDLDGPRYNLCNKYSVWKNEVPPLCRKNFAHNSKPLASAINQYFPPSAAIDGNPSTCTKISAGVDKKRRWWSINFHHVVDVEVVSIFASSGNGVYNMSLYLRNSSNKFNKCANIQTRKNREDNFNEKTNCNGNSDFLYIEDQRLYEDAVFQLCEVAVYTKPVKICGEPDRNPNCLTKNVSTSTEQMVNYYPRTGYRIGKAEVTRRCIDLKWVPTKSPHCSPIPGYIPDSAQPGGGSSQNPKNSNFTIGVAIGVTAASVSTIVVIVVVVVVMRKYYKRGNINQSSTVSDTDGVFLRVNPSSVSSGSPTIQPTYSRPWDDPSLHMYEYIYSDTLPHRNPQSTLNHQKADGELVNIDRGGYLAHRPTSNKRPWTDSKERTAQKGLLESSVPERGNMTITSNSSTLPQAARMSCYNELEVDAYGYTEPEDSCHV